MRKPLGKKPRTSKAKYDYQRRELHSRQDACRLPGERGFRQGAHCECSAKEHHVSRPGELLRLREVKGDGLGS